MTTITEVKSRKELDAIYKKYILDCMDFSGYDLEKEPETEKEKFEQVVKTFHSEYLKYDTNWQRRYGNYTNAFANWLQGLPSSFNIDFENYRILELCREWGVIHAGCSVRAEDKYLDNWWNYMANKFFKFAKQSGVNVSEIINQ